jgi:hypothetical protein
MCWQYTTKYVKINLVDDEEIQSQKDEKYIEK